MRNTTFALFLLLVVSSCIPGKDVIKVRSKSFVASYVKVDGIECRYLGSAILISAVIDNENCYSWSSSPGIMEADAVRHGDVTYDKDIYITPETLPNALPRPDFARFIVQGKSGDSEWCDISSEMMFTAISVAPYIESGYKEKYVWLEEDITDNTRLLFSPSIITPNISREYWPVSKKMNDLGSRDLMMIGHFVVSYLFQSVPIAIVSPVGDVGFAGFDEILITAENVEQEVFSYSLSLL